MSAYHSPSEYLARSMGPHYCLGCGSDWPCVGSQMEAAERRAALEAAERRAAPSPALTRDSIDRAARERTESERLAALGHKQQWDGHCEHRWRNRTSRVVHCRFLDGWREGRAFGAPLPEDASPALTRDLHELREAVEGSRSNWPEHFSPDEAKAWIRAHDRFAALLSAGDKAKAPPR